MPLGFLLTCPRGHEQLQPAFRPTSLHPCAPPTLVPPSPSLAWTNVVSSSLVSWLLFLRCSESSMAPTSPGVKA